MIQLIVSFAYLVVGVVVIRYCKCVRENDANYIHESSCTLDEDDFDLVTQRVHPLERAKSRKHTFPTSEKEAQVRYLGKIRYKIQRMCPESSSLSS
jgi:hypothetical protein